MPIDLDYIYQSIYFNWAAAHLFEYRRPLVSLGPKIQIGADRPIQFIYLETPPFIRGAPVVRLHKWTGLMSSVCVCVCRALAPSGVAARGQAGARASIRATVSSQLLSAP